MTWKDIATDKFGTEYKMENEGPQDAVALAPGNYFYDLYMKCKSMPETRTEEALYYAITCKPGTLRDRGERKIHRKLPSGREVRIWRKDEAKKHQMLRQAQQGDVPADRVGTTNLHERDQVESDEYMLQAQDAVYLAQMANVYIERIRPRVEVSQEDIDDGLKVKAERDVERKAERPDVCPECQGKKQGAGYRHDESCQNHRSNK